jgi:hypothetical protein
MREEIKEFKKRDIGCDDISSRIEELRKTNAEADSE